MLGPSMVTAGGASINSTSSMHNTGSTRIVGGMTTQYTTSGVRTYETSNTYSPLILQGSSTSSLGNSYSSGPIRVTPVNSGANQISTSSNVQERNTNGQIVTKSVQKITDESSKHTYLNQRANKSSERLRLCWLLSTKRSMMWRLMRVRVRGVVLHRSEGHHRCSSQGSRVFAAENQGS